MNYNANKKQAIKVAGEDYLHRRRSGYVEKATEISAAFIFSDPDGYKSRTGLWRV